MSFILLFLFPLFYFRASVLSVHITPVFFLGRYFTVATRDRTLQYPLTMVGPTTREVKEPSLGDLPPELLLHIFSFVRPKHLVKNVRRVNKMFYRLISNDTWWLCRIRHTPLEICLPDAEVENEEFYPSRTFDAMTVEGERWTKWAQEERSVANGTNMHYATVDGVRLFDSSNGARYCLTGGRDRAIKLWSLDKMRETNDQSEWLLIGKEKAHNGWIWAFDVPTSDTVLSCSWDGSIKLWSMGEGRMEQLSIATTDAGAATSVISTRDHAICSYFRSKVRVLDINDNLKTVAGHSFHNRGAVLSIAQKDSLIYSYGEDRRIVCADLRNLDKPVASVKIDSYATNLSLSTGLLHLSTNRGSVLAYRADDLTHSHSFTVSEGEPVRQVIKTHGSVMALTKFSGLKVFSLGTSPVELASSGPFNCEPCRFDYNNGDLAIGCGDGSVIFWHRGEEFDR